MRQAKLILGMDLVCIYICHNIIRPSTLKCGHPTETLAIMLKVDRP